MPELGRQRRQRGSQRSLCRLHFPFLCGGGQGQAACSPISPRPEAPGWRRGSSLAVGEAKPPSLTATGVDSDSSNRTPTPTPRLAPRHPGVQGESHVPSLFWLGRGAHPPPRSLQPSCLPCKQQKAPHHHLEARGRPPCGTGRPRPV